MKPASKDTRERMSLGAQLSAITCLQILASFTMQWYVVASLGAGSVTDALYTGAVLPQIVTVLLVESLTSVIIPLMSAADDREAEGVTWLLLWLLAPAFTLLACVMALAMPWIIAVLVPGFPATTQVLAVRLARVQVVGSIFAACTAPLAALCQVRSRFRLTALCSFAGLVAGCALLLVGLKNYGIGLAAWAQVTATGTTTLLLLPFAGKLRWPAWQGAALRTIRARMQPLVGSKVIYMLSIPADRFLASFLAPGSIVVFELANRFYTAVLRVLSQGILTPFLPTLSRYAHARQWSEFRNVNRKQVLMMVIPSALIVATVITASLVVKSWAHAEHGVRVIGNLTADKVALIAQVLIYMSGLIPAAGWSAALTSAFYAQGDTRTPARVTVVFFAIGVALKTGGFFAGGLTGIALAVTVWAIGQTTVMAYLLNKKMRMLAESGATAAAGIAPVTVDPIGSAAI